MNTHRGAKKQTAPPRNGNGKRQHVRSTVVLVAQPTMALPDTQAQATVSPDVRHVQKMHHQKVRLGGIAGTAAVDAHVVDLAVPLETDNGTKFNLIIRRQHGKGGGLYTPEASALILAHDDLEEAGMHVDYTAGKILTPHSTVPLSNMSTLSR